MNHETFQFNFAALDSKPAAEVLCAQLDAECATCVKRFASTRLRLLNRLTVTSRYLRTYQCFDCQNFCQQRFMDHVTGSVIGKK